MKLALLLASQLLLLIVTSTYFSIKTAGKFISPVITSDYYFTVTDRLLSAFRGFKNNTIWFLALRSRLRNATHTISNTFFFFPPSKHSVQEDLFYRCSGVNSTVKNWHRTESLRHETSVLKYAENLQCFCHLLERNRMTSNISQDI